MSTATVEPHAGRARAPRMKGRQVAFETLVHGLDRNGMMIRGIPGADIAQYNWAGRRSYVLRHPDYVDHVLHGAVERYHKSIEYELLRTVVGLSLFTDEDESWRSHRMMLNPVLAKRHLVALFDLMVDPVQQFVERFDDGNSSRIPLEMTQGMTELTLDVVGSALFGRGMADLARRIGPTVTDGLRAAEIATRLLMVANPPVWGVRAVAKVIDRTPFLPPPLGGLHEIMRTVDRTVWDVIEERRRHPSESPDMLGLLLSVRTEDGQPLPDKRVRDEACTFMLAGHETTANAMSWFWYLMALNTDARDRMLAEIDDVLGDRRPTFADVTKLTWTTACIQEAMRALCPVWVIPRVCVKDDVIDGHRIPKGSWVVIPIDAMHHDPRFWPDPDRFDPERFMPETAHAHHRCSYLPFGGGRRVCIGQSFALIEMTLIAALMSRQFVYDLVPAHPVEPEATFTLRPRYGLKMVARRRALPTALGSSDLRAAA